MLRNSIFLKIMNFIDRAFKFKITKKILSSQENKELSYKIPKFKELIAKKIDNYKSDIVIEGHYHQGCEFKINGKDYINLPKENVILSVRNCWPYFSKEDQLYLPEKLCNHFEKNAVIMIGSFDFRTQHSKDFLKNGFKKAYVKTNGAVFVK